MKYWLDTELAVAFDDLTSPPEQIRHPLPLRLPRHPQLKVLWRIMLAVAVDVVNILVAPKRTPESLLHDVAVFKNPHAVIGPDPYVAIIGYASPLKRQHPATASSRLTAPNAISSAAPFLALTVQRANPMGGDGARATINRASRQMRGIRCAPVHVAPPTKAALFIANRATARA